MKELYALYYHFNSAHVYLNRKWVAHARMDLTQAKRILKLLANDYSDAKQMLREVTAIIDMVNQGYMSCRLNRYVLNRVQDLINESAVWCEVRKKA